MLTLKKLLKQAHLRQVNLARLLGISEAAVAQLVNHGLWPKRLDQAEAKTRIPYFLWAAGHPPEG
jgi:predicted transcriptional regulator